MVWGCGSQSCRSISSRTPLRASSAAAGRQKQHQQTEPAARSTATATATTSPHGWKFFDESTRDRVRRILDRATKRDADNL